MVSFYMWCQIGDKYAKKFEPVNRASRKHCYTVTHLMPVKMLKMILCTQLIQHKKLIKK